MMMQTNNSEEFWSLEFLTFICQIKSWFPFQSPEEVTGAFPDRYKDPQDLYKPYLMWVTHYNTFQPQVLQQLKYQARAMVFYITGEVTSFKRYLFKFMTHHATSPDAYLLLKHSVPEK